MTRADIGDSILSSLEEGVLTITFNRPAFRNAFITGMSAVITDLLRSSQADKAVRCVVFRGAGEHFSAGADITGFKRSLEQSVAERQQSYRDRLNQTRQLVNTLVGFDKPVISALRGGVAGAGLLFPLASDLVLGDETATLLFAHRRMGLVPDGGVSWLLPKVVGWRAAKRLLLSAAVVKAAEAKSLGIMDILCSAQDLDEAVRGAALDFAAASQTAVAGTKKLLNASRDNSLDQQLQAETEGIVESVASADFAEAVTAFLEKRSPDFPSARE